MPTDQYPKCTYTFGQEARNQRHFEPWNLYFGHWFIKFWKVAISARLSATQEPAIQTLLLFLTIAATSLLTDEEPKPTTVEGDGGGETWLTELERTGTGPCWLEKEEFPASELSWCKTPTSTYCACTRTETDWIRDEVLTTFDEEVAVDKTRAWLAENKAGVTFMGETWVELNPLEKLVLIVCAVLSGRLHISSWIPYPGHSHSFPVTSSVWWLHFPPNAQLLSQICPVPSLDCSGKALGLLPVTLWITWPIQPWKLHEWKW